MGMIKDLFSSPKLPNVPEKPMKPVEDATDQIASATMEARRAARKRLGVLATLYAGAGNPALGVTGSPRTATGGLIGA